MVTAVAPDLGPADAGRQQPAYRLRCDLSAFAIIAAAVISHRAEVVEDGELGQRLRAPVDQDRRRQDRALCHDVVNHAVRAVQIMVREGSRVSLGAFACGAAGRVLMLDAIW